MLDWLSKIRLTLKQNEEHTVLLLTANLVTSIIFTCHDETIVMKALDTLVTIATVDQEQVSTTLFV